MSLACEKKDLKPRIQMIVRSYEGKVENILKILLTVQAESGANYVSEEAAAIVAEELGISKVKVYEVITFYSMLSAKPRGKYIIELCKSTPCHVNHAQEISKTFESLLGIKMGETTSDGLFTLEATSCFGACDVSPAAKIGEKVYGNLDTDKINDIICTYRGDQRG